MSVAKSLVPVILTVLAVLVFGQAFALVNDWVRKQWDLPEKIWLLGEEWQRSRELTAQAEVIIRRIEAKDRIARAVLDGCLSLPEAVQCFRAFDRDRSDFDIEYFRTSVPGASDAERYCRHIIRWVRMCAKNRPDQGKEVLRHLEAELQQLVRDGGLIFP
jgi:hypothetical protein